MPFWKQALITIVLGENAAYAGEEESHGSASVDLSVGLSERYPVLKIIMPSV